MSDSIMEWCTIREGKITACAIDVLAQKAKLEVEDDWLSYFFDYAKVIGDYKQRPNMIGMYQTVRPENTAQEMYLLMDWYNNQEVNISVLAEFHARYESIHPFQDGNGRTGR